MVEYDRPTAFLREWQETTVPHEFFAFRRVPNLGYAQLCLAQGDDAVWLGLIVAEPPSEGRGTQLMARICQLADKHCVRIELVASDSDAIAGPKHGGLRAWYEKHGFVQGDPKSNAMTREHRAESIERGSE